MPTAAYKGKGYVRVQMCTYVLTLSLFVFLAACLLYGALRYLEKFNLTFIHIKCVLQKRLFFSNKISICRYGKLLLIQIIFVNQS